ncbi:MULTISPECIES: hypothetical protein [unclassified Rhizobacter]|uniref:hypothetical protein n=1 Tax=unclassified Rhizobacter TaxID=2640088 RepID=UPI0006F8EEC6|nr:MULTISPECIES: hypothetical protein [unclassified Rhizobacter]KQU75619.1 hypothetical protein ASC88_24985 [Rhizobacter sp. Root29]KQW07440.1 hypothetical protein ASC98_25470 [Rhizobacter sp. Root1238]
MKTYTRLQIAENQLRSAMGLFMTGRDRFSVITLAGAADVILTQLSIKAGNESFTADLLAQHIAEGGMVETREQHGKKVNDILFINHCKHLDDDEDGYLELEDVEEAALGAILKALVNYVRIDGFRRDLVEAFRLWGKQNLDPTKYNVDSDPNWKKPDA